MKIRAHLFRNIQVFVDGIFGIEREAYLAQKLYTFLVYGSDNGRRCLTKCQALFLLNRSSRKTKLTSFFFLSPTTLCLKINEVTGTYEVTRIILVFVFFLKKVIILLLVLVFLMN